MAFVDFKEVKRQVSILQVLEHYGLAGKLKRRGDSLSGTCPIHKGHNATQFRVSIEKNCWNCFGKCKRGGNILDFVALMEDVSIRDAALSIQRWFAIDTRPPAGQDAAGDVADVTRPEESPVPEAPKANKPLSFALTKLDYEHAYLTERGLDPETVSTFGLGYCSKGIMTGRVVIPIHNARAELVAYAGRWPGDPPPGEPKYKFPPKFSKSLEVYNLHRAAAEDASMPLMVVEGFFDAIKLSQFGYRRTVALMGSTLYDAQVEHLVDVAGGAGGRILLFFDEDDAGRKGREKAMAKLAPHAFVRVIELPEEGLQPEHLDAEQLVELLG